ncbi:hypothetical protein AAG565_09270 [Fontimonas sp. SYSU GA230001]|uniref:hypothetical protein n=1 Tax=Fontimonas sp. SYSU GA230001 TaxID=3142450 RepID=UPI0032B5704A
MTGTAGIDWHGARYRAGQEQGHYESWFLRANHPQRKRAFWIRYTIFSPKGRPQDAIGELWCVVSDGERGRLYAGKREVPIDDCAFAATGLDVRIGDARLHAGALAGAVAAPQTLRWNLRYAGGGAPAVFLPQHYYAAPLPKAKAVTPRPFARFDGTLDVDGETWTIDDWIGSENHNWGSKHTDTYAWGQIVGFDDAPDAFLEVITARIRLGPLWTPWLTILLLRLDGQDHHLNTIRHGLRAQGRWRYFDWSFDSAAPGLRVHGRICATPQDFVGLTYYNPPGGSHTCLNSKVAACTLTVERDGKPPLTLSTAHRAAFEILTDDTRHGIPVRC